MKAAVLRVLPIGLALSPIGFLFGVLAAQAKWTAADVLLLSTFGFTGSGQFAFLAFTQQGIESVGLLVIFMVILSMNLRYVPMALSASRPLETSNWQKFLLSHCLADESYATETKDDDVRTRATIRIGILLFWMLSTLAGCAMAALLPGTVSSQLAGLTFPISAILFALSLMNVIGYVGGEVLSSKHRSTTTLAAVVSAAGVALLLIQVLGERYFWIPSIFASWLILSRARRITAQ